MSGLKQMITWQGLRRPAQLSEDMPVKWYRLLTEMEHFTMATRWGLANTWGHVYAENYAEAVSTFEATKRGYVEGIGPVPVTSSAVAAIDREITALQHAKAAAMAGDTVTLYDNLDRARDAHRAVRLLHNTG